MKPLLMLIVIGTFVGFALTIFFWALLTILRKAMGRPQ